MRGAPLAALGACLLLLLAGCLLPQEDNILEDIPPPVNQPPSILEAQVQPSRRIFAVDGGADCPELDFIAPVEDPDFQDTLYFDFYVDSQTASSQLAQGTIPPSGGAIRMQPASYTVDFATSGLVQTPGMHFVEVLVADGPLVNGVPVPRTVNLPDGGTRTDPTFAVSYVWLVTVTDGGCP